MKSISTCTCSCTDNEIRTYKNVALTPRRIAELASRGLDVPKTEYQRPADVSDLADNDFSVRTEMKADMDTNDIWNEQQSARRRVNAYKSKAFVKQPEGGE